MSQCRKFAPNIFNKSKCSNCFRQKEEHSAEALECNRASRAIARSGYLFVAPDWDFSVPLNRTKRWQRRWFVLYDDGELNYSVDEHPDTVPQGSVDMCKVMEVTGAEQVTGHPHSLALTSPDRVTFIKAASREDARWWVELLAVFPRRHKRNATFPGGRASPSLPQLGRSASPQPPRPRHLSCLGPSPRTNFITPPLKEERESPSKEDSVRPVWIPEPSNNVPIQQSPPLSRCDYIVSSGSPPTRDKLKCDEKAKARRDWRNERLRDIAVALTDRSPESSLALPAEGLLHLKKGWLWVKSVKEWSKRWCVLCGPTFSTFSDQDESGFPDVVIELSSVTGFNEIALDTRHGFQIHYSTLTLTLSAVTSGIRTNWIQALKKAVPNTPETPPPPATPRSILLSSDEEYRTASEGGRRGSEDWGDLPPSPPLIRTTLTRVKERARAKPRLPRSQSRQSTLDSVSTDELDLAKETAEIELRNTLNKQSAEIDDLKKQLSNAVNEVQNLESELARLKKIHAESQIHEKQSNELLATLEKNEHKLNQVIQQTEDKHLREQRNLQSRLNDVENLARDAEERCQALSRDLQLKEHVINNLQEELQHVSNQFIKSNHESKDTHKNSQDTHSKRYLNSLSDLTNVDLDSNLENLSRAELLKQCLDLRSRFEKSIGEIRAMKKELRDAYIKYDDLELQNVNLQGNLKVVRGEAEAQSSLMANRLQDLTNKLLTAEKQARSLKSKLQDSREKRRSLSLKGRESVSVSKEMEDKVSELEAKITSIEKSRYRKKNRRERSSERTSPTDDRSSPAQRSLRRLRRKSLDSATTSEPMKLLIRLSALESRVSSVANSSESLNCMSTNASELNDTDNKNTNDDLTLIRERLNDCLSQIVLLKNSRNKRASSPSTDKLNCIETSLKEINDILNSSSYCISSPEIDVIDSSTSTVIKQLEALLKTKLNNISEKKQSLKDSGQLDTNAELLILAEKMAYENILVGRIQECLNSSMTGEIHCDRLINKELSDTSHLISSLQAKLSGSNINDASTNGSGVDYLAKILRNCLIGAARGYTKSKNLIQFKVNRHMLDSLKEKHAQLSTALNTYKATKLPQLADALATETISLSMDTSCRLKGLDHDVINDAWSAAQDSINSELIQSEINHIMIRAAQIYEMSCNVDHSYFFSFFASERAALELWSDAVEEHLNEEMHRSINELNEYYQNSLNKLQRQNWRRRVESERVGNVANTLLQEFSDVIAHKALIDARISVLSGKFNQICGNDNQADILDNNEITETLVNNRILYDSEKSGLVQINQSLSAEFKCMFENCSQECNNIINRFNLEQVVSALNGIADEISRIQNYTDENCDGKKMINQDQINTWEEVCETCQDLKKNLVTIRNFVNCKEFCSSWKLSDNEEDKRPLYLGTEYLAKIENLRAAYRRTLATFTGYIQQSNVEQLQLLCDQVLMAMEQWHRRTLQDLRESHISELEVLKEEKEQALAEETQATLAALDAMRKAHEAEVQREVAKFKLDFTRQQQHELLELTERLSVKCLEAAALEEQLGSATRQLAHAQQHILQLERNPQLSDLQN